MLLLHTDDDGPSSRSFPASCFSRPYLPCLGPGQGRRSPQRSFPSRQTSLRLSQMPCSVVVWSCSLLIGPRAAWLQCTAVDSYSHEQYSEQQSAVTLVICCLEGASTGGQFFHVALLNRAVVQPLIGFTVKKYVTLSVLKHSTVVQVTTQSRRGLSGGVTGCHSAE